MKTKFFTRKCAMLAFAITGQQAISCEAANLDQNQVYSDHNLLTLEKDNVSVAQLNTAQLGVLKIFPENDKPGEYRWSCTYRKPIYLKLLHSNKERLNGLAKQIMTIANNEEHSLDQKNTSIAMESEKIITDLLDIGFPIKNFKLEISATFNPKVPRQDLWKDPSNVVKGPFYLVEDTQTHGERLKHDYNALLKDSPDIATVQEVEFGEFYGMDCTKIHTEIMSCYPNYSYTVPSVIINNKQYMPHTITYFNTKTFSDVSNENVEKIKELTSAFECFGKNSEKIQVHALKYLSSQLIYYVVNLHGDYIFANKIKLYNNIDPYSALNKALLETPRIIVAGDFNLQHKNSEFIKGALQNFSGVHKFELTPEPQDESGNPTYDAIFIS